MLTAIPSLRIARFRIVASDICSGRKWIAPSPVNPRNPPRRAPTRSGVMSSALNGRSSGFVQITADFGEASTTSSVLLVPSVISRMRIPGRLGSNNVPLPTIPTYDVLPTVISTPGTLKTFGICSISGLL